MGDSNDGNDLPMLTAQHLEKRNVRWLFVGTDGIRAGWGVLLFVLLFIGSGLVTSRFGHYFEDTKRAKLVPLPLALKFYSASLLNVLIATAVMALIEGRSVLAYGYQGTARALRLVSGLACGFVSLSALVLFQWSAGLLVFDGKVLHGVGIWKYALGWGLVFLLDAFFEESLLRGYLQFTLTRGIGFWWGALLLSLLFGIGHGTNPGETPVGLFSVAAFALVFFLSLWYTGSLWWAVGCHAGWDWAQSYFWGTSDSGIVMQGHLFAVHPTGSPLLSGGATGPEGSLFMFVLLAIMASMMVMWWRRRAPSPFRDKARAQVSAPM